MGFGTDLVEFRKTEQLTPGDGKDHGWIHGLVVFNGFAHLGLAQNDVRGGRRSAENLCRKGYQARTKDDCHNPLVCISYFHKVYYNGWVIVFKGESRWGCLFFGDVVSFSGFVNSGYEKVK